MASRLTFDPQTGRFSTLSGRVVPPSEVRAAIDRDLVGLTRETERLAGDLRAGRLSLEAWRRDMRTLIKQSHLTMATLAQGGRAAMTPEAYGRVGGIVARENQFLEQWVEEIKAGWTLDGRLTSRSALYVNAARGTFHGVQSAEMLRRGVTLERSVTHPAEHCAECLAEAAAGFRPIGVMIPIGSRVCGRNCRCTVVFQRDAA